MIQFLSITYVLSSARVRGDDVLSVIFSISPLALGWWQGFAGQPLWAGVLPRLRRIRVTGSRRQIRRAARCNLQNHLCNPNQQGLHRHSLIRLIRRIPKPANTSVENPCGYRTDIAASPISIAFRPSRER